MACLSLSSGFVKQGNGATAVDCFSRGTRCIFVLCFYDFCPHVKRKKQQNFQLRTWRIFNSSSSTHPFLFSSPTFQLKTLTLCNDSLSRYGTHLQSSYLFPLSSPVSWTEASHITVANDFYVNIFIRLFKNQLLVMQRDFIFFLLKIPSRWERMDSWCSDDF